MTRCCARQSNVQNINILLQTDIPLHVHTKFCAKSDDIWTTTKTGPNIAKKSPTNLYFFCVYQYTYVCNQTVFQYHTSSTEASHIQNVFFQLLYQSIVLQDERNINITQFGLCYQLLIYLTTSLKKCWHVMLQLLKTVSVIIILISYFDYSDR